MQTINILFFGSTTDSVLVLEKLFHSSTVNNQLSIVAIVTQPPRPVGREQILTPTPVEIWGKTHKIAVLSFPSDPNKPWLYRNEQQVIDTLEPIQADLIISASYGQKIPTKTITDAKFRGLNVHPSLLPRWRGGDPVPWAIMSNDHQTGVTVVSLSEKFDEGVIYAQEKIPITPNDTSTPLRTKLFAIGAELLADTLPLYLAGKAKGVAQIDREAPRAKRLSREIGFEPWEGIVKAITDGTEADRIERKFRALIPWPGVWTLLRPAKPDSGGQAAKRLKILKLHLDNEKLALDEVQLEGKKPVTWQQFQTAYHYP